MKLFDQFCMAILFYRGQMYINSLLIKARLKKILNFFIPLLLYCIQWQDNESSFVGFTWVSVKKKR